MVDNNLCKIESKNLVLSDELIRNMLYVDCCVDIENAERLYPGIERDYTRYRAAALQAYQKYKSFDKAKTELRELIISAMAEADGHCDYSSAIKANPKLAETYARYSFAAALSIHRYENQPIRIIRSGSENAMHNNEKDQHE